MAEGNKVSYFGYPTLPENYALNGWHEEAELINEWDFVTDVVTGDGAIYAR